MIQESAGICGVCIVGITLIYLVTGIAIVSIDMIVAIWKYILLAIFLIIMLMLCADSEKKRQLKKPQKGYMYCKKCVRYYALEDGEIPDNFEKKCYCGGKIKYYETLEEITNYKK